MIKMVVCDIDGTIFNGVEFSENLKNCVDKIRKDGIKFVIATGRTYCGAKKLVAPLNIDTPIICYQGATIHSPEGKLIYEKSLSRELSLDILNYLKSMDIYPNIYINDELFCEKETKYVKNYSEFQKVPYKIVDDISKKDFTSMNKLLVIDDDTKKVEWITKHLQEKYGDKIYSRMSTTTFCEICAGGISKGNAVKIVADMFGIKKDEIIGCGDQNNDIELLTCAGVGVAMGNATDTLKGYADYITDTVNNDGVVKAVDKFVYGVN